LNIKFKEKSVDVKERISKNYDSQPYMYI